ncbi:MAG: hypothetical protein ACFB13_19525 [Kiloniellaceae bacterium]
MQNVIFNPIARKDNTPKPAFHFVGRPMCAQAAANGNSNGARLLQVKPGGRPLPGTAPAGDASRRRPAWGWLRRLGAPVTWLWARCRYQIDCARAIDELMQFDDKVLRDIGIENRGEIEHLVRYGRRRR